MQTESNKNNSREDSKLAMALVLLNEEDTTSDNISDEDLIVGYGSSVSIS